MVVVFALLRPKKKKFRKEHLIKSSRYRSFKGEQFPISTKKPQIEDTISQIDVLVLKITRR